MNARRLYEWLSCSILILGAASAGTAEKSATLPPKVPVGHPVVREVTDYQEFTGRTEASASVELRARVSGYLEKVLFQDGAEVKQGEMLFQIDPRPYQAQLENAEAGLVLSVARLKRVEAEAKRAEALVARGAMSREEFDKIAGDRVEAEAAVRVARAACELPRLNLDFTRVRAPVAGRIGRRLLDPGNVVRADETALATLMTLDPIYVHFDIDERTFLDLRRGTREGKKAQGGLGLPVTMALAEEKGFPRRGKVDFAETFLDPKTGTLRLRAVFPNADGLLLPGLFARVRLPLGGPYRDLLVPERAVATDGGQKFVYVITNKVVELRRVDLGPLHDGWRVVRKGLGPADLVVLGKMQQVRPGMAVEPQQGPGAEQPPPRGKGPR